MNWMWGFDETVSITLSTFKTMLQLMKEYPDFTFSQSQASVYKIVYDHDKELFAEIKKRVQEGRWEVSASSWTESDKNLPSAESMVRHILYSKTYLANVLGINKESLVLDFEPDTFGHNLNMPEILSKGGIKYYYFCRGVSGYNAFYWKAPSGAIVLAYQEPLWYNSEIDPYNFSYFPNYLFMNKLPSGLIVYGVGNHGGGATRKDLDMILDMQTWPMMPKLVFSSYKEFFSEIDGGDYKTFEGELNPIFTGCYTSQSRIKAANKKAELSLYNAELFSAFLTESHNTEKIESVWQYLLFNQFHDILTGSGTIDTKEYAMGKYQEIFGIANTQTVKSLEQIASKILLPNTIYQELLRYLVANGTSQGRIGIVRIPLWDYEGDIRNLEIINSDGLHLEYEVIDENPVLSWSHYYQQLAIKIEVQAFGFDVIAIRQKQVTQIEYVNPFPVEQTMRHEFEKNFFIENQFLYVKFNSENGGIDSIIDKSNNIELVKEGKTTALMRLIIEDPSDGMTAWKVGKYLSATRLTDRVTIRKDLYKKNNLFQQFGYEISVSNSRLVIVVTLDSTNSYLEYKVNADWKEYGSVSKGIPSLDFIFDHQLKSGECLCDQPFGTILRQSKNVDMNANNFIYIENEYTGMQIMNKSNYGYRCQKDAVAIKLLRSTIDPDKYPEIGEHEYEFALAIGKKASQKAMLDLNFAYVNPLISLRHEKVGSEIQAKHSFLQINSDDVSVLSVKNTENGNAFIVRFAEINGKYSEVDLYSATGKKFFESNYFEEKLNQIDSVESTIHILVKPFSIHTILIEK